MVSWRLPKRFLSRTVWSFQHIGLVAKETIPWVVPARSPHSALIFHLIFHLIFRDTKGQRLSERLGERLGGLGDLVLLLTQAGFRFFASGYCRRGKRGIIATIQGAKTPMKQILKLAILSLTAFLLFPSIAPQAANVTAPGPRPNVLIITVDDMSADSVGAFGCRLPDTTPNLDRLASQGMRFTRAHVVCANCMPSRNAMWSGLYPHKVG